MNSRDAAVCVFRREATVSSITISEEGQNQDKEQDKQR